MLTERVHTLSTESSNRFDLKLAVVGVQSGNPDAQETLATHLYAKIEPFFKRRLRYSVDDATQQTVATVFEKLSAFTNTGRGTFEENFYAWTYSIARNCLHRYWKTEAQQRNTKELSGWETYPKAEEPPTEKDIAEALAFRERLQNKIHEMLPPRQASVASCALQGQSTSDIAADLGLPERQVSTYLSLVIVQIEDVFLYPAGYKPVSSWGIHSLEQAAYEGHLGYRFLFHYYAHEREVDAYLAAHPDIQKVSRTHRGDRVRARDKQIELLRGQKLTNMEIAELLGVSTATVVRSISRLSRSGRVASRISYVKTDDAPVQRQPIRTNQELAEHLSLDEAQVARAINWFVSGGQYPTNARQTLLAAVKNIRRFKELYPDEKPNINTLRGWLRIETAQVEEICYMALGRR